MNLRGRNVFKKERYRRNKQFPIVDALCNGAPRKRAVVIGIRRAIYTLLLSTPVGPKPGKESLGGMLTSDDIALRREGWGCDKSGSTHS